MMSCRYCWTVDELGPWRGALKRIGTTIRVGPRWGRRYRCCDCDAVMEETGLDYQEPFKSLTFEAWRPGRPPAAGAAQHWQHARVMCGVQGCGCELRKEPGAWTPMRGEPFILRMDQDGARVSKPEDERSPDFVPLSDLRTAAHVARRPSADGGTVRGLETWLGRLNARRGAGGQPGRPN
jgi:hypothetical protein